MSAEDALRNGDVDAALAALFDEVRSEPDQPRHRVFLFQLLCVTGDWDRALTQLNVARDLDPSALVMAQAYQEILQCEALRRKVFEGSHTPLIFGDPEPWLVQMLEALHLDHEGNANAARDLRQRALDEAPATAGKIVFEKSGAGEPSDEEDPFDWIADGDFRMGPALEMIVNGRYYWAPFHRIAEITIERPADLRDVVWTPAQFRWANAGEAVGVIPTRYVDSEKHPDGAIRLARKTIWQENAENAYEGLGQRIFTTNQAEYGLMDVRKITLDVESAADPDPTAQGNQ